MKKTVIIKGAFNQLNIKCTKNSHVIECPAIATLLRTYDSDKFKTVDGVQEMYKFECACLTDKQLDGLNDMCFVCRHGTIKPYTESDMRRQKSADDRDRILQKFFKSKKR